MAAAGVKNAFPGERPAEAGGGVDQPAYAGRSLRELTSLRMSTNGNMRSYQRFHLETSVSVGADQRSAGWIFNNYLTLFFRWSLGLPLRSAVRA